MENKNNVVVALLVVLIGVVSGVGLLIGIGNAVGVALNPLNAKLNKIEATEKKIEKEINNLNSLKSSLDKIQREVSDLKDKVGSGNAPQAAPQPPQEDMNKVYEIPVGVSSILGNPNAPVTITEFSDFQCPFCARFYSAIKDVLAAYPDKVRVVIKNFPLPFHPNARPAAKLAMAANEQGKFQGMMEALLANGGDASDAKIKEYAQSLGLNYDKLIADLKNNEARYDKLISDDIGLGGQVDVRGTPTFYLNGRKTNARDLGSFKGEIDPILAGNK